MTRIDEGTLLWEPSDERKAKSRLRAYMEWLRAERGLSFSTYEELWRWSVTELEAFWESIWQFFGVESPSPHRAVLSSRQMPGTRWFEGASVNYAGHALRLRGSEVAVIFRHEDGTRSELTRDALRASVASVRAGLVRAGVAKGDRVAALMPNCPETVVAFLASASLGAVWSSCS